MSPSSRRSYAVALAPDFSAWCSVVAVADVLFDHIASLHGDRPWGSVLDAGTGRHSLRWVSALPTTRWTAVTADPDMLRELTEETSIPRRPADRIVLGGWTDESLLEGELYDVVLADYLLGAVDGFAPYFQHRLFARLARHVGSRLYVVGLEPLPDVVSTDAERAVTEIARLRDAVLLLCRERPYREFPAAWVRAHLERAGMRVVSEQRFGNALGHGWIDGQLDMCARRLARLPEALSASMGAYVEELRGRAHAVCDAHGKLRCGADHVLAAERV